MIIPKMYVSLLSLLEEHENLFQIRLGVDLDADGKHSKILDNKLDKIPGRVKVKRKRLENAGHVVNDHEAKMMGFDTAVEFETEYSKEYPNWTVRYAYMVEYADETMLHPSELAEDP